MTPFWLTVFIDLAPEEHDRGERFWREVTGYSLSPRRGDHGEFVTLVPPTGDPHLKVQRLAEGPSGVHLDLHVTDLQQAVDHALTLGATLVAKPGHAVLASPAGFTFCLVGEECRLQAPPTLWPDGHRSMVDQVAVDIPPAAWEEECAFWAALTGWDVTSTSTPEFRRLNTPSTLPVRVLLQRLDEGQEPATGHLDLAASDRNAEVERHLRLGAAVEHPGRGWVVMGPPAGPAYCITDRRPETGLLG